VKRSIAAGLAAAVITLTALPGAAHATEDTPCGMPSGWYANPDEQDRLPTPATGGLKFEGNDLIHHATDTTVEHLTHGTYSANPAPDQPSFFSVEVTGTDGGYATLRWDTATGKWTMVTGGQLYTNAGPAALVDMVTPHKSHHVVSFGVGYTANPPGTVTTVVSSVTFGGKTYDLTCKPAPSSSSASPTASPSTSASTSAGASPSTTASSSSGGAVVTTGPTPPAASGGLPITGPQTGMVAAGAVAILAAGALLLLLVRRRRTRFTA
jgi:LPXTG-motif cell wall-anchored protein